MIVKTLQESYCVVIVICWHGANRPTFSRSLKYSTCASKPSSTGTKRKPYSTRPSLCAKPFTASVRLSLLAPYLQGPTWMPSTTCWPRPCPKHVSNFKVRTLYGNGAIKVRLSRAYSGLKCVQQQTYSHRRIESACASV